MFERKYKEGEDVPLEDAAMNNLEGSIVSYDNNIEMFRSRMRVCITDAKKYQDQIDDYSKRKRALEEALRKLNQ